MNKLNKVLLSISFVFVTMLVIGVAANKVEAATLDSTHAYYDALKTDTLYTSDKKEIYTQLDTDLKAVYDQLVTEIKNIKKSNITLVKPLKEVHSSKDKELEHQGIYYVLDAIYHDHPELYWFGSINGGAVGYTMSSAGKTYDKDGNIVDGAEDPDYAYTTITSVILCYNEYADNKTACDSELETLYNNVTSGINKTVSTDTATNAKKVLQVHNNLCKYLIYDYEGKDASKVDNTVYGTLKNKKAVCAGYARTFQYILHRLGIDCYCVLGEAWFYSTTEHKYVRQEDHEWNVVKLGSDYINIDATWGDRYRETVLDDTKESASYISYSYFAVADEEIVTRLRNPEVLESFAETHRRSDSSERAVPHAKEKVKDAKCVYSKAEFKNLFGKAKTDLFVDTFDEQYVAVVKSIDEYFAQVKEAFRNGSYYKTTENKINPDGSVSKTETVETNNLISETRYVLIIGEGATGKGLDLDITQALQDQTKGSKVRTCHADIKSEMELKGTVYKKTSTEEYETTYMQELNEGLLWTDIDCAYWTISQYIGYINKDCMPTSHLSANMRGDLNGDKIIDQKDAIKLLMAVNFPSTYSVGQSRDMDGDGKVTSEDAIHLLLNSKFPRSTYYTLNYKKTVD